MKNRTITENGGSGLFAKSSLTLAIPWTIARQASVSMGFSRQEYRSGLPCSPSGDLPDPGIEPTTPVSPALAGEFFTKSPPGKPWTLLTLKLW